MRNSELLIPGDQLDYWQTALGRRPVFGCNPNANVTTETLSSQRKTLRDVDGRGKKSEWGKKESRPDNCNLPSEFVPPF